MAKPMPAAEVFKINGSWHTMARRLQEKFAELTDADLKLEAGKEEALLIRIENRLNKKREEVINIIKKGQPTHS